ncbi:MAG TPA: DUF3089 domain-containing protein [Chitinophagaceae bacterium]|nr:DUF3089 domain-containing protein [Chitinophagaceae bacterium]
MPKINFNYQFCFRILITVIVNSSCTPSYYKFISQYSQDPKTNSPDYSNLSNWSSHPDKKDPADSIPYPLKNGIADSSVDVFFIHPTTYTKKHFPKGKVNADIFDATLSAKTDYTSILYQASVFNASCRIFAPRYKQAHLSAFFKMKKELADKAFDTAYNDIRNAFEYYLQHYNNGRPFIIASHSQGTLHAARLIKEFIEDEPLKKQLVCAYLIGLPVPQDYFTKFQPCKDSTSTGCFVSWRTLKRGYLPPYVKMETTSSYVTNPLLWTTDTIKAPRTLNKGAILWKFNKILLHSNDAQIHKNVLWIQKPKFPFSFLIPIKNFHAGDINLFYVNIRENIKTRIAYWKQAQVQ